MCGEHLEWVNVSLTSAIIDVHNLNVYDAVSATLPQSAHQEVGLLDLHRRWTWSCTSRGVDF
jgi:hypothetical protein